MSEQKKVEKKAENKPGFFARAGQTVSKWFRDFKSECKKIVWPSRKHVINNTLVVIGFAIAVMILVYVLDVSFGFVRDTLVKLI
ncbi:MAG: preprotein translocase subunit SecE [Clostridia bacterium]|nr:preprotein translocase subunit SecE [Clostridia bacterium]MBQ3091878.1 preprotein translocase subunit SecE [Clostridia bacterium]MBQ9925573.1 preprotein translocase subunit SecE [Clostridia bacterium]